MKTTMWTELQANECEVKRVDDRYGNVASVQIKHPSLPRALWFTKSQKGNWYWRKTGRSGDTYADGYIIRGSLDGIVGAPRLIYPI
jgi:hypothetical protein